VQYGLRVTAIVLYLYVGQFLSKQRSAQALTELFGTPVSAGTVATKIRRASGGLTGFLALVRDRISGAEVARISTRPGSGSRGNCTGCTPPRPGKYSLIVVHSKRGRVAMDAAGVLPSFTGIAVHDAWAPYDCYPAATHALCNAHLLRELIAVAETAPQGAWCWAEQVRDALLDLKPWWPRLSPPAAPVSSLSGLP
jgi:hypothetical protein